MPPILANAGVPMLFLHVSAILVALLPIIAVEMYMAYRMLGRPSEEAAQDDMTGIWRADCSII